MVLVIVGVIGSLASVGGLYAIFDARRNRRVKFLAYEVTWGIPLATAAQDERDYSLSIHYKAAGSDDEEVIDAAFVKYLRFANFGREPIRREDIAPANALRVKVDGARVLDISLSNGGREVTQVDVAEPRIGPDRASARVTFDFLDHRDGGVLRILTTSPVSKVSLDGDIIGMPSGIQRLDQAPARSRWGKIGFALWLLAELASLAFAAAIVKEVSGDWTDAWLLAVPIVAFLLPLVGAFVLSDWWPPRSEKFPKELALPNWLGGRLAHIAAGDGMLPPPGFFLVEPESPEGQRRPPQLSLPDEGADPDDEDERRDS